MPVASAVVNTSTRLLPASATYVLLLLASTACDGWRRPFAPERAPPAVKLDWPITTLADVVAAVAALFHTSTRLLPRSATTSFAPAGSLDRYPGDDSDVDDGPVPPRFGAPAVKVACP